MQIWETLWNPTESEAAIAAKESVFLLFPLETLVYSRMWELMYSSMDLTVKGGKPTTTTEFPFDFLSTDLHARSLEASWEGARWTQWGGPSSPRGLPSDTVSLPLYWWAVLSSLAAQAVLTVPHLWKINLASTFCVTQLHLAPQWGGGGRWVEMVWVMNVACFSKIKIKAARRQGKKKMWLLSIYWFRMYSQ